MSQGPRDVALLGCLLLGGSLLPNAALTQDIRRQTPGRRNASNTDAFANEPAENDIWVKSPPHLIPHE
jgi:hypothetical protein